MSGGSYDYAYRRLEEFADDLREEGACDCASPELRNLFREHVRLVAKAMKAIEWNDSCDGDDWERKLILECLRLTENGEQKPSERVGAGGRGGKAGAHRKGA